MANIGRGGSPRVIQPKGSSIVPGILQSPAMVETLRPLLLRTFGRSMPSEHPAPEAFDALIASYNVHKCVGLDGVFDPDRTTEVIAQIGADIIALQEVDERFGERRGLLDLTYLRDACGLVPIPLRPTRKGHGWHGNLVLCREGLVKSALQLALPGIEPRGALMVDLALTSGPLRIVAAHLGLLRSSRSKQVDAILSAIETEPQRPTLVMGDLNEWRLGRRSSLRCLDDAFRCNASLSPSFPASFPVLPLDRIIGNQRGLIAKAAAHDTPLARKASDHLPVKAWVQLPVVRHDGHEGRFRMAA